MTEVGTERKGALYFNPSSGTAIADPDEMRDVLESHSIDLLEIGGDLDVVANIQDRQARGERLFIAAGGDGTIHHVVQGLANTDSVLGIVPLGTFNHLARDLELPADWRDALDVALDGIDRYVDLGKVNGLYFANNISLGLYPEVVARRERMRAKIGKWIAYPLALLSAVRRLSRLAMTIEAPPHFEVVKTRLFFVAASPYNLSHLGMIAPRESLQAGKLAVYWLPESTFGWKLIRALLRYVRGKGAQIEKLRRLHVESLEVRSPQENMRVGIDGELTELESPLKISIARSALTVRVSRK